MLLKAICAPLRGLQSLFLATWVMTLVRGEIQRVGSGFEELGVGGVGHRRAKAVIREGVVFSWRSHLYFLPAFFTVASYLPGAFALQRKFPVRLFLPNKILWLLSHLTTVQDFHFQKQNENEN